MARRRFYAPPDNITASAITLSTHETHHLIHVLRMTPGDEAFPTYIRNALIMELNQAGAFSAQANITLTSNLDKEEYAHSDTFVSSSVTTGAMRGERYLVLVMTVKSSNGKSLTVRENYELPASPFLKGERCKDLARAFKPAVHNLIGNLFRSPEFPVLIKSLDDDQGKYDSTF